MITDEQKTILRDILGPQAPESALHDLHLRLKCVYVKHPATSFRITVGHHDHDRFPGALRLKVGDVVNLVALTTERYIPAEILEVPTTPAGYFRGVVTKQLATGSRFEVGDSVYFSEDQVQLTLKTPPLKRMHKKCISG